MILTPVCKYCNLDMDAADIMMHSRTLNADGTFDLADCERKKKVKRK